MISVCAKQKNASNRALTLLEITIAVTLLAAALIPVFTLTIETTTQTHAMEKHLMASQFAAGILDRYLAMSFRECATAILSESFPVSVSDVALANSQLGSDREFVSTIMRTFNDFSFDVVISEPSVLEEFGEMFRITVNLYWLPHQGALAERQFSLSAVKYNENP